jgi:hypothetical protein
VHCFKDWRPCEELGMVLHLVLEDAEEEHFQGQHGVVWIGM